VPFAPAAALRVHHPDTLFRAPLTSRTPAWYREGRRQDCVADAGVAGVDRQGRPLTVAQATPWLIGRGDLLAALDRAATRKVTIISAPAGSGKTSLLRSWTGRQGQGYRLATLQVQRDQQDAQQFWLALLNAARHASPTNGRAEPPTATPDFNGRATVDRVLSELADAGTDIMLVIDDLHELNSPEALAQLTICGWACISCGICRRTYPGLRSPASCLCRCTRSTRISAGSTPSSRSVTAPRPCSAPGNCGCWRPAAHRSPAVTGSR
jgi:hypothetical protein